MKTPLISKKQDESSKKESEQLVYDHSVLEKVVIHESFKIQDLIE